MYKHIRSTILLILATALLCGVIVGMQHGAFAGIASTIALAQLMGAPLAVGANPVLFSKLSSISAKPTMREYAQGAAQRATAPVADFLAPTVPVATSTGQFKVYTEKDRFHLPETRRAIGGRAATIAFDATDATYNCAPHSLDYPVDNLEQLEEAQLENRLQEGATACAEIAALVHEKTVIDKALTAAGAGTDSNFTSGSVDPVAVLDAAILSVLKAAKYGSLMSVGVLFGATAFLRFKNNSNVRGRFVTGSKNQVVNPSIQDASAILLGNPETRASFMVYDSAANGVAENIEFLLDTAILVFARMANPTRRDPSFMKTFRLMGQFMVPGTYMRDDGRVEVAKYDWSEDVQVTNSSAIVRINATAA